MRFNGLDLNLLVLLDALLQERNVTRAAARLNLSQAAASNALNRLRQHFHDDLLVQVGRKMHLTDRALAMQSPLRDLLERLEHDVLGAEDFAPRTRQDEITIIAADAAAIALVGAFTARIAAHAPGLSFIIHPPASSSTRLQRMDADLMVIPKQFAIHGEPFEALMPDPFVVLACATSRWARQGPTRTDYLSAGHVTVQLGPTGKIPIDRVLIEQTEGGLDVKATASSHAVIPWLLADTDYIATVPASLARQFCRHLPLIIHPLPFDIPATTLVVQWNQQRQSDRLLMWLKSEFLDHARYSRYE